MPTLASLFITTLVLSTSLWAASPSLAQEQSQDQNNEQPNPDKESVLQQDEPSETDGYLTAKPDKAFYADDLIGNSAISTHLCSKATPRRSKQAKELQRRTQPAPRLWNETLAFTAEG